MKIGLFIPCYVDQFYPQVGIACLQLLEKLGLQVQYPLQQTCCGQPLANAGFEHLSGGCNANFVSCFAAFDYVVAPSGSCVVHIKEHLKSDENPEIAIQLRERVWELSEFLTDVLKVEKINAHFPHKVGLHQSCHGLRCLKLAQMSEQMAAPFSKPGQLLTMVAGLELIDLQRADECCGFGGTFAVSEEAVSVKMGKDRILDHEQQGAAYITGADMSCLMHLEGIMRRQNSCTRVIHIAEILNASL